MCLYSVVLLCKVNACHTVQDGFNNISASMWTSLYDIRLSHVIFCDVVHGYMNEEMTSLEQQEVWGCCFRSIDSERTGCHFVPVSVTLTHL